jgi:NAD(P)H-dependent FMN reductase
LKTAAAVAPEGVAAVLFDGLARLPLFNVDDDVEPLPTPVRHLRNCLASADAVFFSTPEYAGSLPGSFKNLLDWTVGGGLHRKPVGWINPSPQGGSDATYATLRVVLGFVDSRIVEEACVKIAVTRDMIDEAGFVSDSRVRAVLADALARLADSALQGTDGP